MTVERLEEHLQSALRLDFGRVLAEEIGLGRLPRHEAFIEESDKSVGNFIDSVAMLRGNPVHKPIAGAEHRVYDDIRREGPHLTARRPVLDGLPEEGIVFDYDRSDPFLPVLRERRDVPVENCRPFLVFHEETNMHPHELCQARHWIWNASRNAFRCADEVLRDVCEDGPEQFILALEVVIDAGFRVSETARDLIDRDAVNAMIGKQLRSAAKNLLANELTLQ
jgi:hypothetical protein